MKTSTKSPSYIVRNAYSYCFRMNVPQDLHRLVGKKELRYSLKTGYLGVAKQKARYLTGQVPERVVSMLVGHVTSGQTSSRYAKPFKPKN